MPNNVKNRITLIGDKSKIKELVDNFSEYFSEKASETFDKRKNYTNKKGQHGRFDSNKNEFIIDNDEDTILNKIPENFKPLMKSAWVRFPDFNKLIPMPEELNITSGSLGETAQGLLFGEGGSMFLGIDELQKRFTNMSNEDQKESIEFGIKYHNNTIKYGYPTWYAWANKNWGTKWNAYSCEKISDDIFEFDTAWCSVIKIIRLLSQKAPDIEIKYEWASEDTGSNCGTLTVKNDIISEQFTPESQSKEAYELAFSLRPDHKEYYALVDGNYVSNEEDE